MTAEVKRWRVEIHLNARPSELPDIAQALDELLGDDTFIGAPVQIDRPPERTTQ